MFTLEARLRTFIRSVALPFEPILCCIATCIYYVCHANDVRISLSKYTAMLIVHILNVFKLKVD